MDTDFALQLKKEVEDTGTTLVAVSKTKPTSMIQYLYDVGFKIFGENRVQELVEKHDQLPKDIEWHMIGNLQSNKVKYIAPFVSLIHSVSSRKLLETINKEAKKVDRIINVLLQLKIAEEESKSGMELPELMSILEDIEMGKYPHIQLSGLMGMATFTDDTDQVQKEFRYLRSTSDKILATRCSMMTSNWTISMGMSGDYKIAIAEGSNMVRIGSLLFGSRL